MIIGLSGIRHHIMEKVKPLIRWPGGKTRRDGEQASRLLFLFSIQTPITHGKPIQARR
jgi:hypothetical protein